ncbi:MAG: cytochrome C oxidase subunit IV family protein [Gammaproteobacteria bacterium]|nr:cytochrome C oxidase subunit IV family protein [Gammaproteobacteria bacterium]MBQ0838465.1 cytochrome C oxidase subunit IV family protein [Gammaproteobacteria bacterium]
MLTLLRNPVTVAWFLLMLATCLSWWLGLDHDLSSASQAVVDVRYLSTGLILIAFIKVRIVIRYFMEVGKSPLALRLICDAWVLAVCAVILYLYWFPLPLVATSL